MSTKIVLTKIKNSTNILHKESKLVLKSQKEKIVIGRMNDEGEIVSLNNESVVICKQWGFKYDPDFVEQDEDQEETENVEDQEETENVEDQEETENVEDQEETENVEDQEETENVVEEEKVVIKQTELKPLIIPNQIKTSYIRDLTNEFSSQLYGSFDLLHQTYLSELSDLQNNILSKNKIIEELNLKYEKTENELNILKKKFEGIKSLFS